MISSENLKKISINNYVRKASHRNNYWLDISKGPLDKYRSQSQNFNVIIYSELNSQEHYYVIPYSALKNILKEKYFSKGKSDKRKRWVGNIQDHKLKIANCSIVLDLSDYYLGLTDDPENKLLRIVEDDIESVNIENDSKFEGGKKSKYVSYYERNIKLRADAIKFHGTKCKACGFDFKNIYGSHGENFIEVHHLKPLHSLIEVTLINPKTDMTVLCSNCHRMVHRKKNFILSLKDLKKILSQNAS